ncbi:MAG TPA: hypothetical protein VGM98_10815 [Schlesneria sp.]|jgi:hypothetical protein
MASTKGELSVVDWLLCIFCSLIGCIVGIVALIQGDSRRGGIMIGVSFAAAIFWNILRVAIVLMTQGLPQQ